MQKETESVRGKEKKTSSWEKRIPLQKNPKHTHSINTKLHRHKNRDSLVYDSNLVKDHYSISARGEREH
jgi:hypothetical protein